MSGLNRVVGLWTLFLGLLSLVSATAASDAEYFPRFCEESRIVLRLALLPGLAGRPLDAVDAVRLNVPKRCWLPIDSSASSRCGNSWFNINLAENEGSVHLESTLICGAEGVEVYKLGHPFGPTVRVESRSKTIGLMGRVQLDALPSREGSFAFPGPLSRCSSAHNTIVAGPNLTLSFPSSRDLPLGSCDVAVVDSVLGALGPKTVPLYLRESVSSLFELYCGTTLVKASSEDISENWELARSSGLGGLGASPGLPDI